MIVKFLRVKYKEQMLKATREKICMKQKRMTICLYAGVSVETMKIKREFNCTLKGLKDENINY